MSDASEQVGGLDLGGVGEYDTRFQHNHDAVEELTAEIHQLRAMFEAYCAMQMTTDLNERGVIQHLTLLDAMRKNDRARADA